MVQISINGAKSFEGNLEESLGRLYEFAWERAIVYCLECGIRKVVEEEVELYSFVGDHGEHFGVVVDLETEGFLSLEAELERGVEV